MQPDDPQTPLTQAEAQAEAARRNGERPRGGLWAARHADGDAWQVVRLVAPGLSEGAPTGAHVESRPRPESPDPRGGPLRDIPPYGAG